MIEAERISSTNSENYDGQFRRSQHDRASAISTDFRIAELELENVRLQRLVAELLLKNQQLRKDHE